jgi:hypothetical protein
MKSLEFHGCNYTRKFRAVRERKQLCGRPHAERDPDIAESFGARLDTNLDMRSYNKRRWSNLDRKFVHVPGTIAGSAALIAGTTIGAGILALPQVWSGNL